MHASRLIIENYRGITRLDVPLAPRTVLIGENNAGKSSVLDAFRICLDKVPAKRGYVFREQDFQGSPPSEIRLECTFVIPANDPDEAIITRKLRRVVSINPNTAENEVILRVTGTWNDLTGQASHSPVFLNPNGDELQKNVTYEGLNGLCELVSCKSLHANRTATHDFRPTAQFLGPILDATTLESELAAEIEAELDQLGSRLVANSENLKLVVEELMKLSGMTDVGHGVDGVRVSPLPPSIKSLLQRTEVRIKSRVGTDLPIGMHGAGTQSLAAFFLFSAFAKLAKQAGHCLSAATIEEPEAHLHPWAVSSVTGTVNSVADQVVVSTHSGEFVGECELTNIRRLYRLGDQHRIGLVPRNSIPDHDQRKLHFHVFGQRGYLLFGRMWLFVEGETEFHFLPPISQFAGSSFSSLGVYVVPFAQTNLDLLIPLADQLGITWHVLSDGDAEGSKYAAQASSHLNGRVYAEHITQWSLPDIESVLWENGFQAYYEGICPAQKLAMEARNTNADDRRKKILKSSLRSRSKPGAALDVVEDIRANQLSNCPPEILQVITNVTNVAQGLGT
tara:strand:+ start:28730 stop:30421 length:1692 start_codon:yes stop_codon:yes gene_type:complete